MAVICLQARDNEGFQIAPTLIIFLVILGAGCVVCCLFAVIRLFYGDLDENAKWTVRSPAQDAYMREVRERNLRKLPVAPLQYIHSSSRLNLSHAPVSPSGGSTSAWG